MAKALLIAEKPALMRNVKAVYEKYGHKDEIHFKSFAGHTMGLIQPQEYNTDWEKWNLDTLPMIPEKFRYAPTKYKFKIYKEIKDEVLNGGYDYVINCCDAGREGQHIFFSFYDSIGCKLPVKRMWHHDYTDKELKRALDNLRDEKEPALINMTKASKLRAYFDWLIGMNFTRTFSIIGGKKANIGRVMTPTLKIIVDRELEIKNFIPKDFWEIEADFGKYKGVYFNKDGETQFFDKTKAEAVIKSLLKEGTIVDVEEKKEMRFAPELHSLANLQNEANKVFGYTMSETLAITQSLYEKQLLSYPRTDSAHLTTAISKEFKKLLKPLLTINEIKDTVNDVMNDNSKLEAVGKNKKYVDGNKVSDHYAITPTGLTPDFSKLTQKETNIYTLVAKRFLSIFLPPMVTMKTTIITEDNKNKFKTVGSVLVDLGYMALYSSKFANNIIPKVTKGEKVEYKGSKLLAKKTSAPTRYTDETLNNSLEKAGKFVDDEELKEVLKGAKGIGTPATRGDIVEKLVSLKMIERKRKSFYALDYGISIIQNLRDSDIVSPELTAKWEQKLSEIETCKYDANDFYKEMIDYIKISTENMKNMNVQLQKSSNSIGVCPKCGRNFIEGKSYYLCTGYEKGKPNSCNFVVPKVLWGSKISVNEMKKILEGKETKEYPFKIEKNGQKKEWTAKLVFNKSKGKIDFAKKENSKGICKCPSCNGEIKEGKSYYLCENYKKTCSVIIPKEYKDAKITKTDVKALLNGKETEEKEFKWKNGNKGKAKLKYTSKLEFIFNNNRK